MRAYLRSVISQVLGFLGFGSLGQSFEIHPRSLRIDDDHAIAGKLADHVWRQAPVLGRFRNLLDKITVAEHSSQFNGPPKLHLSPVAAHVRRWRGLNKATGLIAEFMIAATVLGTL